MNLMGKVVIITGASSGIGEATARRFAKDGALVVVNYKSGAKRAKDIVAEIGISAMAIQADVSDPKQVESLFKQTIDRFKKVDILINNAGVADEPDFLEASLADWQEVFSTDLFGTMLCSQAAAKIMLDQKSGKIINISSIYGIDRAGREGLMAYSAAKAAMINFTRTLAKLLAPNITVNVVAPGYVQTPSWEGVPEEVTNRYISRTQLKRWIEPEEIAEALNYLVAADAVTGEVLVVDAGRTLLDY